MKLPSYEITMPDFTEANEHYEGKLVGSWKARKIEIGFSLSHGPMTISGFVIHVDMHYSYLPKWGQDVYKAYVSIVYEEIEKAATAAGWSHTLRETDPFDFYGYRCPPSIWKEFLKEEYRYHR
jgi:hypothetical protein